MAASESKLIRSVLDATPVGMLLVDKHGTIVFANEKAAAMHGWQIRSLAGQNISAVIPKRFHKSHRAQMMDFQKSPHALGVAFDRELIARRIDDSEFPVEISLNPIQIDNEEYVLASIIDISDRLHIKQVEAINERLTNRANCDSLTKLSNRRHILKTLQTMLSDSNKEEQLAVAFLDLDGFKAVNDEHGHDVGDEVLQLVAKILKAHIRKSDAVGRLGGDEFLLCFRGINDGSDLTRVLGSIIHSIESLNTDGGEAIAISASVGALIASSEDNLSAEQLVKRADQLMYEAKRLGRAQVVFGAPEQN